MIFVPGKSDISSIEMITIDPRDLQAAQDRDKTATHHSSATSQSGTQLQGFEASEDQAGDLRK
jgi:hypothetical protein